MEKVFSWRDCACLGQLVALLGLIFCWASPARATPTRPHVLCQPDFSLARREELAAKLRSITNWPELSFANDGELRLGKTYSAGGSPTARTLLTEASNGQNVIVLEDASHRPDVVFSRVVAGRWTRAAAGQPPVYVLLIDFADFQRVMGDAAALAAFNVGWAVLHEIAHVVHDSGDAPRPGEVGACEAVINLMRRECGLAERADYYFSYLPGTNSGDFKARFVRLAFDQRAPQAKGKKRYWVFWDAALTGGLSEAEVAAR